MRIFVILAIALGSALALAAAPASQDDQYLVTLDPAAAVDRGDVIATQLAAAYGGTVISTKEATFIVRMAPSRVRALSADPRVITVVPLRDVGADAIIEPVNWSVGVSYTYDGAGNITAIGTDPASSDTFAYDDVGRLVQAKVNGNTRTYNYDAFGNRLGCKHNVTTDCQHAIQITSSNNHIKDITYDPAGNGGVTKFGTHDYSYDAVNMMTRDHSGAGKFEYLYTADDERIATYTANMASWGWTMRDTSGKVLREFSSTDSGAWQWTRDYVYRNELLLASVRPDGDGTKTDHYHLDHLGSARRVTNDADDIIGYHDYYAFGPEISGSLQEPAATQLKYTAHEREPGNDEFTLDYMHARFYNHTVGRFLSPDPVSSTDPARPGTWNKYAYALNDPMGFVDRNGQWPTETHNMMIEKAFPNLNYRDLATLMAASEYADNFMFGGQNRAASFEHGMRAAWQTVAEAQALSGQFYKDMIAEAKAANNPKVQKDPMFALGRALHLIMDMTSPSHVGFQVWDFNRAHIRDHMAREARKPTKEELDMAVAMMRAAFAEVYGVAASDAAAGVTPQTKKYLPPGKAPWEPTPIPSRRD